MPTVFTTVSVKPATRDLVRKARHHLEARTIDDAVRIMAERTLAQG